MKIKLLAQPPVDPAFGLKIGSLYEVVKDDRDTINRVPGFWVLGINNKKVKILAREYVIDHSQAKEE